MEQTYLGVPVLHWVVLALSFVIYLLAEWKQQYNSFALENKVWSLGIWFSNWGNRLTFFSSLLTSITLLLSVFNSTEIQAFIPPSYFTTIAFGYMSTSMWNKATSIGESQTKLRKQ